MGPSQQDVSRQEQQARALRVRQEPVILLTQMVQVVQPGVQKPLPICAEVLLQQIINREPPLIHHQSGNRAHQAVPNILQPIQGQGQILQHHTTAEQPDNILALHRQAVQDIQEVATAILDLHLQAVHTAAVPVQPAVLRRAVVLHQAGHHL